MGLFLFEEFAAGCEWGLRGGLRGGRGLGGEGLSWIGLSWIGLGSSGWGGFRRAWNDSAHGEGAEAEGLGVALRGTIEGVGDFGGFVKFEIGVLALIDGILQGLSLSDSDSLRGSAAESGVIPDQGSIFGESECGGEGDDGDGVSWGIGVTEWGFAKFPEDDFFGPGGAPSDVGPEDEGCIFDEVEIHGFDFLDEVGADLIEEFWFEEVGGDFQRDFGSRGEEESIGRGFGGDCLEEVGVGDFDGEESAFARVVAVEGIPEEAFEIDPFKSGTGEQVRFNRFVDPEG